MKDYTSVLIDLTHEEVLKFQQITYELYKRKLSYEEAEDQLLRMVSLAELVLQNKDRFDTKDHLENDQKGEQNGYK